MPLTTNYTERFDDNLLQAVHPAGADTLAVTLAASTTFPVGCLLIDGGPGTVNSVAVQSIFQPYVAGVGTPSLILQRACATDSNNNITFGAQSSGEEFGQTYLSAPAYYKGLFRTQDLPQSGTGAIDSTAVANGGAHQIGKLIQGTLSEGLLLLGV